MFNAYSNYPKYSYINKTVQRLKNPPFSFPEYTHFSPLFQSFNVETNWAILQSFYGDEFLNSQMESIDNGTSLYGDYEDLLSALSLEIQQNFKSIYIIDRETGELLYEISNTPENLAKKIEDIVPIDILDSTQIIVH